MESFPNLVLMRRSPVPRVCCKQRAFISEAKFHEILKGRIGIVDDNFPNGGSHLGTQSDAYAKGNIAKRVRWCRQCRRGCPIRSPTPSAFNGGSPTRLERARQ